ncbi:MAG: MvaI/BcnI restriction endonuclease family protein [Eubacterium sp.]|nr:MvaI/BcnI restriction endonuclease family protein [Eubacterium sp.]
MLAMADTNLEQFLPIFASTGAKVAFLSPTPTGMEKSIMDAIGDVRILLKEQGIHDYDYQGQGPENKVIVPAYFVMPDGVIETAASLYRPVTKKGDPRIWFSNMKRYCNARNLLALVVIEGAIYVINLSDPDIADSLFDHGFVYQILKDSAYEDDSIVKELLSKILDIHHQGFLPSITPGDPGVGDTLENALGIARNNIAAPDYKGIELKATRLTRGGQRRSRTRVNLFAKVPEYGYSYSDIVREYGKWIYSEKAREDRLAIDNTTFCTRINTHGLVLEVDTNNDQLHMCHVDERNRQRYLSYWLLTSLRQTLLTKHHETFWVKAQSINREGIEWFRYDYITHTKNPNDSLFAPLIESDKIQVDLAGYFSKQKNMKWRDHGMLFKMWPEDLPLLFGEPEEYDLTRMTQADIWR